MHTTEGGQLDICLQHPQHKPPLCQWNKMRRCLDWLKIDAASIVLKCQWTVSVGLQLWHDMTKAWTIRWAVYSNLCIILYSNHQVVPPAGDEATELLRRQHVPPCSLYQHKPPQHVPASDSSSTTWLIWVRLVFLAALIRDLIISQVCRNFELQTPFALKIHEGQGIVRAA